MTGVRVQYCQYLQIVFFVCNKIIKNIIFLIDHLECDKYNNQIKWII